MPKVFITDTTLRDGSHAVAHRYTREQAAAIARGLDRAGIDIIEVGHGDGLAGSSLQYGISLTTDRELIESVAGVLKNAKLAVLLLPGIGTTHDLEMAYNYGARVARIATHVTEADIAEQHMRYGKTMGMTVVGFLMMAHMACPAKVAEQSRLMESYGADIVYAVDSAGALLPNQVSDRIAAMRQALSVSVGFHAHNNLALAMGNTLAALEAGATYLDACLNGMGAGAGNTQTEALIAVLNKYGIEINADLFKILDVADMLVNMIVLPHVKPSGDSLMLGYAGVYSSFLLHARRIAEHLHIDARDILVELGKRKTVGGQEDMIADIAYEIADAQRQKR